MPQLRKPSSESVQRLLRQQNRFDVTYDFVGATATSPPAGFAVNHLRVWLGEGDRVFEAAKLALQLWRQYDVGWVQVEAGKPTIATGAAYAVVAHSFGLWWINPCRIVYVIDDQEERFGFACGTLPRHVVRGEERFLIETKTDGSVWYDLSSFSRPAHVAARVGYLGMRRVQSRFSFQSARIMQEFAATETNKCLPDSKTMTPSGIT